jgi:hypothetical protein
LAGNGVKPGRDKFFNALRDNPPLLEKPPSFAPRTANSRHCLPVFGNLVKGMVLTGRNRAAYPSIRGDGGFICLALIPAMRPGKIAGCQAGNTLEAGGALAALKKAATALGEGGGRFIIPAAAVSSAAMGMLGGLPGAGRASA